MNSDSAFYIGKTHQVCQDYAIHGISKNGMPFAIISDGCSSSPDTDFGSRFLAKMAADPLENIKDFHFANPEDCNYRANEYLLIHAASRALQAAKLAEVLPEAVDATLLIAQKIQDRYLVICAGDGVIAKLKKDGTIEVTQIEYESGAPYYLNYGFDSQRNQGYKEKFGLKRKIKRYSIVNRVASSVTITEDSDGSIFGEDAPCNDYSVIVVMSDGVLSFMETQRTATSKVNVSVEPHKVISELLAFKNYGGVFVQRRFQKFRKDCEERGWFSVDDVSIGAIHLE